MRWPFAVKEDLTLTPPEKSVSPSTRFAFKLFRQLGADQETRNVFFSPASVMLCLCLLREGATGKTRETIDEVLEVAGVEPEASQLAIVALKSALRNSGDSVQFEAGNSLWCVPEWTPRPEYVTKVREHYDADVIVLDSLGAEMVARINSWVSAKTRGKIERILDTLAPLTSLLAVNAIYFKDLWNRPFERELTREESFHTSEGGSLKIPLMSQFGRYRYYEESKFQAVRLGYKTSNLAMYIFLPRKNSSLREFQQDLNSAAWDKWTGRFETVGGHIRVPRFKLTYMASLKSALATLGMGIAFDPGRAQFDAINPPPSKIWIDEVLHRAFVEVNEEGTEAAAVTVTGFVGSALHAKPERTFEMIVDRPFFFAICDDYTKSMLFMGSVDEPHS